MKIKRFDENMITERVSSKVRDFVETFTDGLDSNVMDYVRIFPEMPEYENIDSNKKYIKFAEKYNLINLKKYLDVDIKIEQLRKEAYKLEQYKEEGGSLYLNASYELLYKFQEDLINKNFDKFVELILDVDENDDGIIEDPFELVHPNILIKYKKIIELKLSAKKYNL